MHSVLKHHTNALAITSIVFGVVACIGFLVEPSLIRAEILLFASLMAHMLYEKSSHAWTIVLYHMASLINFWIHPALWIWSSTGSILLGTLWICSTIYQLSRPVQSKHEWESYMIWLPAAAGAIGAMALTIIHPEWMVLNIGLCMLAFLAISNIPTIHVVHTSWIAKNRFLLLLWCLILPWIYGGDIWAVGLAQGILLLVYIFVSIITLLIPHYVFR
jgi:phosphatidylserine synthase